MTEYLDHIVRRELKPLHHWHHLYWFLFGSYHGMVLVLVVLVMTRPSSPKTVFECVFFYVFGFGDFAGSSVWKVSLFQPFEKSPLLGFNIFIFYRVAFVFLFPTKLDSLDSDFICKIYGSSSFTVWIWSGVSGPLFFAAKCPSCGAVLDWGPEVHRRWSGVSGPPESPVHRSLRST